MTPLETEANPNIRVGPLRWGRPADKSSDEKLVAVAEALEGLLTGLQQMTKQANQSSAISLTFIHISE